MRSLGFYSFYIQDSLSVQVAAYVSGADIFLSVKRCARTNDYSYEHLLCDDSGRQGGCNGSPPCSSATVRVEGYVTTRMPDAVEKPSAPPADVAQMLIAALGATKQNGVWAPRFAEGDVLVIDRGGPDLRVGVAGDDLFDRVPKRRWKAAEDGACSCSVRALLDHNGCARTRGAEACEAAPNGLREVRT